MLRFKIQLFLNLIKIQKVFGTIPVAKDDNCITCGGSLAHNQAYHASDNIAAPANSITPSATPPVVEPAQNVTGVWHYTCGNGCAGGAGVTGICGTCGDALAHNPVYHQEGTLIQ
jgi:hypothetical protein